MTLAILAPPVFTLLELELQSVLINEEKKEIEENELEEKTIYIDGLAGFISLNYNKVSISNSNYKEELSNHTADIFLPPPEFKS